MAGATQAGKEQAEGEGWAAGGYGVKVLTLASEVARNWCSRRLPAEVERIDTAADELHPPGGLLLVARGFEPHDLVCKTLTYHVELMLRKSDAV
jgi:hypothetical protein